ncbi:MAG: HD domain-containing protein [Butyrivibrio sp.]|uniref:HDIG domain-containing protein n=1 Tax=Butyrivibrio hungatei TaxID=185008 RepID=A0A1G5EMP1_9FIRM|nr:HD domain-containing phosphohydrolase [Butyrivibrio hungatei]MBQ4218195.1 HD domain-containing protein [Butyrivibrio sp.]MBR4358863.1 HD domain-containing protein [Butyrivibrio sp.]SCY28194.1 HDIG domain-containing protein [Butyrivibrio hungatei]
MKLLAVDKLVPGLIVSENIYTIDDRLVLAKGTVLDEKDILRIKSHSLYNIFVEDDKPVERSAKEEPTPEDFLSYADKLKNSEGFIRFKRDIEEKAKKLEESFKMIANDGAPLEIDKLTEPVYHLFVEAGGTAGVFDMLHNLRDNSDAVFMHSLNVSLIANTLATWMRLPEDVVRVVTAGGLLHDIGKMLMPPDLLNKKAALTEYEERVMRDHVTKGYELVKDEDIDQRIKNCILMHHEFKDGSGYPLHLKGDKIDEVVSIVTVSNIYDEMTSRRTYRAPICPFTVISQFEKEGINKFDPNVIMTFLGNIANTFIANRVMLNTGQTGEIIFVNADHLSRPVVKCGENYVDLSSNKSLSIVAVI